MAHVLAASGDGGKTMEKKYENSISPGDCTEVLKELPDESVDVGVTVDERDRISRLARAAGLRIDIAKIRDRSQALRVIQTLELFRSRMR